MKRARVFGQFALVLLMTALLVIGGQALTAGLAGAGGGGVVSRYGVGMDKPQGLVTGPDGAL